jgi:tryptophanyl-tRNA synthetase
MTKKTLLSGIQPSGKPHIGNYFGLMKPIVDMQDEFNCHFFIADYHALNTIQDKKVLAENILNIVIDYCAIGFDPQKSIIFKQLTNMRASGSDDAVYLAASYKLNIEKAMEIMNDDEFIEITPKSVRLRKKILRKK